MLILGLDPGTKNFAYSIIKVDDPEYNFLKEDYLELPDVLETGMLKETYEFCKAETMQRDLLIAAVKEITTMAKDKNIDVVGFERWMARPGQVVPGWVERLNYTLGALLHSTKIPIYHVQPSAWKVTIKRRYGIESTKTLFNMFNTKGGLQSDTQTVNLTSKTQRLRKELAARDLLILQKYKKKKSST